MAKENIEYCPCCGQVPHPPSAECSFAFRPTAPGRGVDDLHPLVVKWLQLGNGKRSIEVRILTQQTWPYNVAARDEHGGMVDVRGPSLSAASYAAAHSFLKATGFLNVSR